MLYKKDKRNKSALKVLLVAKNVQSCVSAAKFVYGRSVFTSVLSIYRKYMYAPFILFRLPYDRHDSVNVCAHSKF